MKIESKERFSSQHIQFSDELRSAVENLSNLEVAPNVPKRLQPLLDHLSGKVGEALKKIEKRRTSVQVCGPDWCRANLQIAGSAHASVIVETYGETYALPNKYPEANIEALKSGNLDMYLMFEDGKAVGTACMVIQSDGWAELGRSASLGGVGNQAIQDLRIVRWLTEQEQAEKIFGLFSTCRTAPDRNIGTDEAPEIMRGGQAVTHMWSQFPEVMVGGYGPLYKKHGALEQFAYTLITNKEVFVPTRPYIFDGDDRRFVDAWSSYYHVVTVDNSREGGLEIPGYSVHYPPLETGLTHLIHGEITLSKAGESFESLDNAINRLDEVKVPFIQVQVPVDSDSRELQRELIARGFQAFLLTPGIEGKQSPLLWFGKVTPGVSVVPTYWQEAGEANPFWGSELSGFAAQIANKW